jgi:hypothetical protein
MLVSDVLIPTESLLDSPLLEKWTDPHSGAESFLLTEEFPFQQSFYFVNPSWAVHGRYYWFYVAFPPSGNAWQGRSLAVADFQTGEITHFPETQFLDASPAVDLTSGDVYWSNRLEIWKRSPHPETPAVLVNRFPESLARQRLVSSLATHLTFSADRSAVNIDALIGGDCFLGHAPLDGSEIKIWRTTDRFYHHAQFSPTDPDLQLVAQDHFTDPSTGQTCPVDQRMWLLHRDGRMETLYPGGGSEMQGHEWWSADGQRVWYVHYRHGLEYIDLADRKPVRVWPSSTISHGHASASCDYLVADFLPPEKPQERRIAFFNTLTGRSIDLISYLPHPPAGQEKYHVHAHPQFCCDDRFICYTTTVRGRVDVAFASVESLILATQL